MENIKNNIRTSFVTLSLLATVTSLLLPGTPPNQVMHGVIPAFVSVDNMPVQSGAPFATQLRTPAKGAQLMMKSGV